jgi:Na+-transporting methylmalonyl-CoA/oxaloacetate decarboxylase gamma subunit
MSQPFILSLQITLIGMSLVFGAILLLWLLMALLTHLTPPYPETDEPSEAEMKQRAASAAVAIALAAEADATPHEFPLPPTALVSAWQAVMRSKMLIKRGTPR